MNAKGDAEKTYSYVSTGRLPAEAEVISLIDESIARPLQSFERIYCGPAGATDLYTKQYALNVSARDLAVMCDPGGWWRDPRHESARGRCGGLIMRRRPFMSNPEP